MSKKDFIKLANILAEHAIGNNELQAALVQWLRESPRFDEKKFLLEVYKGRK